METFLSSPCSKHIISSKPGQHRVDGAQSGGTNPRDISRQLIPNESWGRNLWPWWFSCTPICPGVPFQPAQGHGLAAPPLPCAAPEWMNWDSGLGCLPPHCHSWGSSQGQDLQFYVVGEDTSTLEGCSRCLCSGRSRKVLSHLNWILPFLPESQPALAFPAIKEPDFPAGISLQWGCLAE